MTPNGVLLVMLSVALLSCSSDEDDGEEWPDRVRGGEWLVRRTQCAVDELAEHDALLPVDDEPGKDVVAERQ